MTITVTTCGECPFNDDYLEKCNHPKMDKYINTEPFRYSIHPSCPESGPFTIITKPKNTEDEIKTRI